MIKDLLDKESKWCKGAAAYNSRGKICDPIDDDAVQWSLDGAIQREYPMLITDGYSQTTITKDEIYKRICNHPRVMDFVSWYNDRSTYEEIISLVRELDV